MGLSKKTAAVLFGCVSSEYEVSLRSAASVLRNFPRDDYNVIMIGVTKDGRWYEYIGDLEKLEQDEWCTPALCTPALISPDRGHGGLLRITPQGIQTEQIDVIFPVVHGENCEDGGLQGLLEISGIPYVGCGVASSACCMDKDITHRLLQAAGIEMTPYRVLTKHDLTHINELCQELRESLGYPVYVKPACTGSSVGVSCVKQPQDLQAALELALGYGRKVVVEKAVVGREVECGVLGNYDDCIASSVGEIVPLRDFYDYEGKYLDDSTQLFIPARIESETASKVRQAAARAFQAMGCSGLARVDFFVRDDGAVILNELNTLPGFTSISMYPKLFEHAGIAYPELIGRLLRLAMERKHG